MFLAAPCWEAKGSAAAINLFQRVPVCTRQRRGPGVGSAAGRGGLALGRWGPPPRWARHLGPFLPTNSPPCPRCYRNNSMDVGDLQGSHVTLPLAQPPLGRASAQCPFLACFLMLLNDGRRRSCGSSGLQSFAIWRKGRANPAGTPHPKPGSRWYYAEWGRLAECGSAREVSWFLPPPLSAFCPSSTEVSFLPWTLAPRAPQLRRLRAGIRDTRWRWCSASRRSPPPRPPRRRWPRPRTPDRADARTALLRRADAVRGPDRAGLRGRSPRTSGRRQVTRPWSGAVGVGAERAWGPLVLAGRDRPGSAAPCPPRAARARGGKAGRG